LESYNKHHQQLQGKGMKLATVLEILAEQSESTDVDTFTRLSKILAEKETARAQLTQRIQSLSIEIMAAYPVLLFDKAICDKLLNEMKGQKNAIHTQKKRREQAENIMLKESGELGNLKNRKIVISTYDRANLN
jgi:hypothetical protein